jgi:hypothetical protein
LNEKKNPSINQNGRTKKKSYVSAFPPSASCDAVVVVQFTHFSFLVIAFIVETTVIFLTTSVVACSNVRKVEQHSMIDS